MKLLNSIHSSGAGECGCGSCRGLGLVGSANPFLGARLSRRGFLGAAAVGVTAGLLPVAARASSSMTPAQALQEMAEGNRRFTEGRLTSFDHDLAILKQKTADKQEPFAAILSCADSRVPVELIFDQSIGHLFVTRVAGNVSTVEMIASLEYGVAVLGAKAIMVLGHSNCGAIKATIDAKAVPGQISALYSYIRPAVDLAGTNIDAVGRANVKIQATILRESSPLLAEMIQNKSLEVVAGFYDLASGKVEMLS
jgi:carbonic anhydrase